MKQTNYFTDTGTVRWAQLLKSKGGGMQRAAYHWYKLLLTAAVFLLSGNVQQAQAGDVTSDNCLTMWSQPVDYDPDAGFYFGVTISYWDNTGWDIGIANATFSIDGESVFEISTYADNSNCYEDIDYKITVYNGFYVVTRPQRGSAGCKYWDNGKTDWQSVRSGSSLWRTCHSNSYGYFHADVLIYLPQKCLNKNLSWSFNGKLNRGSDKLSRSGTIFGTTNKMPELKSVDPVIDRQAWTYKLVYSLNGSIDKEGVVILSDPVNQLTYSQSFPSGSSTDTIVGTATTTGKTTTYDNAYILLDHGKGVLPNQILPRIENWEIKWVHVNSGHIYSIGKKDIKVDHIRFPEFTGITNEGDGTLKLSWKLTTDFESDNTSKYRLEYKAGSADWKKVSTDPPPYSSDHTKGVNYTFTIPSDEI